MGSYSKVKFDDLKIYIEQIGSIIWGWLNWAIIVNLSMIGRIIYKVASIKLEHFVKTRIEIHGDKFDLSSIIDT